MIKDKSTGLGRLNNCSQIAMGLALASGIGFSAPAFAKDDAPAVTAAAADAPATGEILVTARRKSENILKTPITITALTSEDISARGIQTLQDIGNFVPGVNVVGQATQGGRADRSFVGIVLRGIVPSTSASQTTSIFIDGAPVTTATALETLNNPARVEVIKGPQSALFGRQTFAGALNIVTKSPTDHLTGDFSGMIGTRGNYDASGEISAPIIADVLSFRASLRAFGKDGSYHNAAVPGQTLGDQKTKTGSLELLFKPTPNLTVKAFGLFTELNDGPSAQGVIASKSLVAPNGSVVITDQHNCTLASGKAYFCGVAPGLSSLTPSLDTANDSVITNFLANPVGRVVSPSSGPHGYGLVNHFNHEHVNIDWKLGASGVTVSSLTAFNSERKSELADLDNFNGSAFPQTATATTEATYNFPFLVEGKTHDFSQELRASFENGGPVHAAVGGSYLNGRNQSASGSPLTGGAKFAGVQQNRTMGAFYALGYDFSKHFSLNADGRYQVDKIYAYAGQGGVTASTSAFVPIGVYPVNSLLVEKTYKNFMPRVIAQYNFDTSMVYASFSKGVNPGAFNTSFITSTPAVVAAAQALGYQIAVAPEKITNWEVGTKGRLFGSRIHYDAAGFYAIWTDQIQSQSQTITIGGLPYQVVASTNAGEVHIKGAELSINADVTKRLSIDAAGAFTDAQIVTAKNSATTILTGITDFSGKQNPFTSKWSGNIGVSYTAPLTTTFDGYGRADFVYKSGSYSDVANIVRSPDLTQVNLRLGVRNKAMSVEGFVTNLFNNRAYYNVVDGGIYPPGASITALIAQLRDLRTFGIRASYRF